MSSLDNKQQFCWERIFESNNLFRISHFFVPRRIAGLLLPLHALFASLDLINNRVLDDAVARKKLDWWRHELLSGNISKSRHPVIRLLDDSGAVPLLPSDAVEYLLDGVEFRLNSSPPSNFAEFELICRHIVQPRIILECALTETPAGQMQSERNIVLAGGLGELLRESSTQDERAFWWLPLHLMARFHISRREFEKEPDSAAAQNVLGEIFNQACPVDFAERGSDNPIHPGHLNICLINNLQLRVLDRMRKMKPSLHGAELRRRHFSDLVSSWKYARKINLLMQ
jgi:phytoene synthase